MATGFDPPRVLIVEDQFDVADAIERAFTLAGWMVNACEDAHKAVELIRDLCPDVVVVELGMEWFELRRWLGRGVVVRPAMITIGGWRREPERNWLEAFGYDASVSKPIDAKGLATIAASFIRGSGPMCSTQRQERSPEGKC